jgi:hypothetical protein
VSEDVNVAAKRWEHGWKIEPSGRFFELECAARRAA